MEQSSRKNRNYGIELLRIVLMLMICILHVLGKGGVLSNSLPNTIRYKVFWGVEIFAYSAVDSFAIISGYTSNNNKPKYEKLIDIWFQAFFYSFVITIILTLIGKNNNNSIKEIIKCGLPITFNKYWYITAYFALFFAMPIINKFTSEIDEKNAKKMLIITIFIYSIMGIVCDSFNTNKGYSTIWLMVLYYIGALAKKINLFKNRKSFVLIIIWIFSILVTWITKIYFTNELLINYISPTILLNGIIMVILFSRIKTNWKIVYKIAPLTLGIYFLQLNQVIWDNIINDAFIFIVKKNTIIGVLNVLFYSFIIFIIGLIVEYFRRLFTKIIRLSSLNNKILKIFNTIFEKIFVILR